MLGQPSPRAPRRVGLAPAFSSPAALGALGISIKTRDGRPMLVVHQLHAGQAENVAIVRIDEHRSGAMRDTGGPLSTCMCPSRGRGGPPPPRTFVAGPIVWLASSPAAKRLRDRDVGVFGMISPE